MRSRSQRAAMNAREIAMIVVVLVLVALYQWGPEPTSSLVATVVGTVVLIIGVIVTVIIGVILLVLVTLASLVPLPTYETAWAIVLAVGILGLIGYVVDVLDDRDE